MLNFSLFWHQWLTSIDSQRDQSSVHVWQLLLHQNKQTYIFHLGSLHSLCPLANLTLTQANSRLHAYQKVNRLNESARCRPNRSPLTLSLHGELLNQSNFADIINEHY